MCFEGKPVEINSALAIVRDSYGIVYPGELVSDSGSAGHCSATREIDDYDSRNVGLATCKSGYENTAASTQIDQSRFETDSSGQGRASTVTV